MPTDPIAAFRAEMEAMTPGKWEAINQRPPGAPEWVSVQKFIRAPECIVQNDRGPSYATEVLSDEDYPTKDADLIGIVRSVTIARRLAAEGAEEMIARMIDPSSWRVFDGYLADVKRKYKGKDAAYDPAAFKDRASMAKARAIIAAIVSEEAR